MSVWNRNMIPTLTVSKRGALKQYRGPNSRTASADAVIDLVILPRILFILGTGAGRTYDDYSDGFTVPYVYSKDTNYKNPSNTGILVGYPTQFRGYTATASRQSDCLPDSEQLWPMWNYNRANTGTGEIISYSNNGNQVPWTQNTGGYSLNNSFTDPYAGAGGRITVTTTELNTASNWFETCYSGHNPVQGYWTPSGAWTPGLAAEGNLGSFPSRAGDDQLYWVRFDSERTAITWTRGEANVLHPTRRVVISNLTVIL